MSEHPLHEVDSATSATTSLSRSKRTPLQWIQLIGPAFVVGAWQFGPGNLTTAVQAGSQFLYDLIWVVVISTILMIFLSDMSVRIGIKSPVSLISSIKDRFGTWLGVVAGVGVFCICLMFSVGNAVGSGLGLSMVFGGSPVMWSLICTVAVGGMLFFRNVYKALEKAMIVAVMVMAIAFISSAFIAHPDWGQAALGLVPSFPDGGWLLLVALVGTNFSVNAAFFTSYGTKERKRTTSDYRDITIADTIPGIVAPGIMTSLVIVVAAAVFGQTGEEATSITALAKIFEPLAGPVGSFIFSLGFFAAAFSSMIANATAGGIMLSDGLGRGASSGSRSAKIISGTILAFGAVVTIIFQSSPVQLIVIAQALTVIVAPVLAILVVLMSNYEPLMGALRNKWWQNVGGVIGILAVLTLSIRTVSGLL